MSLPESKLQSTVAKPESWTESRTIKLLCVAAAAMAALGPSVSLVSLPALHSSIRLDSMLESAAFFNTNGTTMIPESLQEQYRRDGYAVLRQVLPQEVATELRFKIEETGLLDEDQSHKFKKGLLSSLVVGKGIPRVVTRLAMTFQPAADAIFMNRNLPSIVRQLLGGKRSFYLTDSLFIKLPGEASGGWHRDTPTLRVVDGKDGIATVWMPLTPVTENDGGSLMLAPMTHKWEEDEAHCSTKHHAAGQLRKEDDACRQRLDAMGVALPAMEPGDAVIFNPHMYHKTAASWNLSEPRIALSFWAVTDEAKYSTAATEEYSCAFKPRVMFAMEDAYEKNDYQNDSEMLWEDILPQIDPSMAVLGPKHFQEVVSQYDSAARRHLLGHTLLKCRAQEKFRQVMDASSSR